MTHLADHILPMDFRSRSHIPIAHLNPSLDTGNSYVKGIVTLIWPYSSSKQYTSILLAEPDFRLRRKQGQVRISFKGRTARAVARSGLTSGDEILIGLDHAKWLQAEASAATPGRGVDWELQFGNHVILQFIRNAEELVQLDPSGLSPSPPPEIVSASPLHSERTPAFALASTPAVLETQSETWKSPAFLKRKSFPAAPIFSTLYDLFSEDGNSEDDRRRKKTKIGRASGQWRFSERSPSPEKQTEKQFEAALDIPGKTRDLADRDHPISVQLTAQRPCENVPVNQLSPNSSAAQLAVVTKFATPQSVIDNEDIEEGYLPDQPRLRPQASPELLVVSPFQDRKTKVALFQDQAEWAPQTAGEGRSFSFHRGSPDLDKAGQVHESQEYMQDPEVEYAKPSTVLDISTGSHDESADLETLNHEYSQPDQDAPTQDGDGLNYSESYGTTVSLEGEPSLELFSSMVEEVGQRGQTIAMSSNSQLPKNVQQDVPWDSWQAAANERSNPDIPRTGIVIQAHERYDMSATLDDKYDKMFEVEEGPNFIQNRRDALYSELVAESQPSFTADESDYDASDLYDDKQEYETGSESTVNSLGEREGTSSVGHFQTTLLPDTTILHNNTIQDLDQNRMEVISIGSGDSEESGESEESEETNSGGSEEPNSPLPFDPPINMVNQDQTSSSPGETPRKQITVSHKVGSVVHSTGTLDQLEADNDIGQSVLSNVQSDLKDRHIYPFTPEASGLSSIIFEQGVLNDERALRPKGTSVISEQEFVLTQADRNLSYDSPIVETGKVLITPHASQLQQVDEYASRVEIEVEAYDDNHNLLTPQNTQSISEERYDTVVTTQSRSLIGLLRQLRSTSVSRAENSSLLYQAENIDIYPDAYKDSELASSDKGQSIRNEESDHDSASQGVFPDTTSIEAKPPKLITAELVQGQVSRSFLPVPPHTGYRTPLSYFVSLSSLPEYFNSTIDVMVIAVSASHFDRATKGPRDYYETVYITDRSSAASESHPHIISAQIFRPFKIALPIICIGDVVLLRNFKVQTQKQKPMLLSTDSSAWAVFRKGCDVQIRGPQLEFGPEEMDFARDLGEWWVSLDEQSRVELLNGAPKPEAGAKGKGKEKEKARRKSTVVHELRDGTRYVDGQVDGMDGVHELRDGTVYTDDTV